MKIEKSGFLTSLSTPANRTIETVAGGDRFLGRKRMEKKVALVTGGTYGIGRAITLALARENFAVVAFGNQAAQGHETSRLAREEGLEPTILQGDVSTSSDVARIVAAAAQRYGRIDVLCNNAAIRSEGNLLETEEQTWDRIMAVNLRGVYLVTRAVLPHMIRQQGGVIITTGSTSGHGAKILSPMRQPRALLRLSQCPWRSTMPKITFAPCWWFRDSL